MNHTRSGKPDSRESGLVQRMRSRVRDLPIEKPWVLLACSGGKDSVALAFVLSELKRLEYLQFSIAHIHHGQHDQADAAAAAVRQIGDRLCVDVIVQHLDTARIDTHKGVGLEEAMRRERYLTLVQLANEIGADCIALAHHQTDQAETILLHLMRGSGLDGLAGMHMWELRQIPWWDEDVNTMSTAFWRPFLHERVEDIASVAAQSELPVLEDPTNTDIKFRRNAIRHELLPMMERIAAGSTAAIARSADVLASDHDALVRATEEYLEGCQEGDGLSRVRLVSFPVGMQRRVVRAWILRQLPIHELTADRVDAVVEATQRNRGGVIIQIGCGLSVRLHESIFTIDS